MAEEEQLQTEEDEPTFEIVVRIPYEDRGMFMDSLRQGKSWSLVAGLVQLDAEIVHIQPWGKYHDAVSAGAALPAEFVPVRRVDAASEEGRLLDAASFEVTATREDV